MTRPMPTSESERRDTQEPRGGSRPFSVRLPGFVREQPVGLGDAIKRVTYAVGIKPCGGCGRRAAALNRWVVFTGRSRGT
jgi:hypothetical protein